MPVTVAHNDHKLHRKQFKKTIMPMLNASELKGASAEGWLFKQGGAYKWWSRRWFVLHHNLLYYFKSNRGVKASGVLVLSEFHFDTAEKLTKRPYSFVAYNPTRQFVFAAESEVSRQSWLENLRQAATIQSVDGPTDEEVAESHDFFENDNDDPSERVASPPVPTTPLPAIPRRASISGAPPMPTTPLPQTPEQAQRQRRHSVSGPPTEALPVLPFKTSSSSHRPPSGVQLRAPSQRRSSLDVVIDEVHNLPSMGFLLLSPSQRVIEEDEATNVLVDPSTRRSSVSTDERSVGTRRASIDAAVQLEDSIVERRSSRRLSDHQTHPSPVFPHSASGPLEDEALQDMFQQMQQTRPTAPRPHVGIAVIPTDNVNCEVCGLLVFKHAGLKLGAHLFHSECVSCSTCGCELSDDNYGVHRQLFYCRQHAEGRINIERAKEALFNRT